jgi:polysaccharide biosynthesis transport protein
VSISSTRSHAPVPLYSYGRRLGSRSSPQRSADCLSGRCRATRPNFATSWAPEGVSPIIEMLRALRRHRVPFLFVAVVVTLTVAVITFCLTPLYTAAAVITLRPDSPDPLAPVSTLAREKLDDGAEETSAASLRSRHLAQQIVERLGIDAAARASGIPLCSRMQIPVLCRHPSHPASLSARVDAFLHNLDIVSPNRSRVLSISYTSPDPRIAAEAVNLLVTLHQQDQLARRSADLTRTTEWLKRRAEGLHANWLAVEQEAGASRATAEIADTSTDRTSEPLVVRQIANTANDLSQARAQLAVADSRAAAMENAARSSDKLSLLKLSEEPLLVAMSTALNTLYANRAQIAQHYGQRHPTAVAINSQIAEAERKLSAERTRALQAVHNEAAIKRGQVLRLEQTLTGMRAQNRALSSRALESRLLDREAASARSVYEMFLERAKQADDRAQILQPSIEFVSQAEIPEHPSFPNVPRFIGAGLVLGLACAAGTVFAREHLGDGFSDISRVSQQLAVPLLATIPLVGFRHRLRGSLARHVIEYPFSISAEAVRSLAAQITLASNEAKGSQSVLITSATSQEGKSTICIWLAGALAQAGQSVLVIDGDHRKGAVQPGLPSQARPGLTDYLMARASLNDLLQQDEATGLHFIAAGTPMPRPFSHAEFTRLRGLISEAKQRYSLVIMDAPPSLAMAEALLYANVADQTVIACRWQRTSRAAVLFCIERLHAAGAVLTGIVLCMVDREQTPSYIKDSQSRLT